MSHYRKYIPRWPIVSVTHAENRHELVLSGTEITKLLESDGFDDRIYDLDTLNFLEISHTSLDSLSDKIAQLRNLAQLGLTSNQLTKIPVAIGQLTALRFLDLSCNQLKQLPTDLFSRLGSLTSLNLTGNALEEIPNALPNGVELLSGLVTLDVSYNVVTTIPDELSNLLNLKTADFSNNSLLTVPACLHRCRKLHALRLQNNPIKDNRLRKLTVESHSPKALIDYLRRLDDSSSKGGKKGRAKTKVSEPATENGTPEVTCESEKEEPQSSVPHIVIQRPNEEEHYVISQTSTVKSGPRPYLIACTIHGITFKSDTHLKSFTRAQEEWHRGLGQMRRRATLATHDLNTVQFPLSYTLQKAGEIEFHALNATKPTTGDKFLCRLYQEAESDRKTRKQAKFSQLYRYLNVLHMGSNDLKEGFRYHSIPTVLDASQTIISMPPLSNCEQTRLKVSTTDILLEVSGITLDACKELAETVIAWLLENVTAQSSSLSASPAPPDESTDKPELKGDGPEVAVAPPPKLVTVPAHALVVRPIRVVDSESSSNLSSIFPSRLDLIGEAFHAVR